MIKSPVLPVPGTVARLAPVAQPPPVFIVLPVAGNASNRRIPESLGLVTLLALYTGVFAQQRKRGNPVIEIGGSPGTLVMTTVALLALLSLVYIVLLMAGVTGLAKLLLAQHALVTRGALDLDMCTTQGKVACPVVIEFRLRPAPGGMAAFALVSEFSLMAFAFIIASVAGNTFFWRLLVVLRLVTGPAFHIQVFSE